MFRLFGLLIKLVLLFLLASVLWVALYRVADPPATYLMVRDWVGGRHVTRDWRPLSEIDRDLPRAVIAAEDSRFCDHGGFDLEAIAGALRSNVEGGRLRGGSTISQQVAKNVFLWPERSWVRKALEAWFTFLIETLWDKARIMEVYLNVVELGRGVYGAQAGAEHYFDRGADRLSTTQAARLAAILPSPIERSASTPGPYTRRYSRTIERRMRVVSGDGLDGCLRL